jgi:hypothetical protein
MLKILNPYLVADCRVLDRNAQACQHFSDVADPLFRPKNDESIRHRFIEEE